MEQPETRDEAGAGRTQHAIHIITRDDMLAAPLLCPGLERVDASVSAPQVLVVAPDRDSVFALAAAVNSRGERTQTLLIPIVASAHGERRLHAGATAICATAEDLVALMSRALFKPAHLRSVAVVWADEQLGEAMRPTLETVLAEVPRDADRMLLVGALTESVESFATGFLWRARRMQHTTSPVAVAGTMEYAVCVPGAQAHMVRLLLERIDPMRLAAVVFSDAGERDAGVALTALGYRPIGSAECRIVRDRVEGSADLALIMEVPSDLTALATARGDASRAVVLVPPSQLVAVAAALGDGGTPLPATQALRDAYTARDTLRDEIVGTLRGRPLTSEVLALEPLVAERDPLLLAAALWRLLETERGRVRKPSAPSAPAGRLEAPAAPARPRGDTPRPSDGAFTRLFINIGERDGMRRGDLVGAITGEAGIDGSQIGKIELRDSHTLVEVSSDVAEQVVTRLTGVSMRGRKVMARVDGGRPAGERPARGRDDRPPRRDGGRGDGGRGGPAGGRVAGGGARGGRDVGGKRDEGGRGGGPRAMRESEEWGSRGDRLRQSRPRRNDA